MHVDIIISLHSMKKKYVFCVNLWWNNFFPKIYSTLLMIWDLSIFSLWFDVFVPKMVLLTKRPFQPHELHVINLSKYIECQDYMKWTFRLKSKILNILRLMSKSIGLKWIASFGHSKVKKSLCNNKYHAWVWSHTASYDK